MAYSLATSASNFKVPLPPKFRYGVEVKYRPSIPNNVKHWKVFEDDLKIKKFLETVEEFSEEELDGGNFLNKIAKRNIVQLPSNHIPRGLVPLERIFDRNDVSLKGETTKDDTGTVQCNIGTESSATCQLKFMPLKTFLAHMTSIMYEAM